jgi:hypothetical protein
MLVTNITWDVPDNDKYDEDELTDYLGLPTEVEISSDIDPDDVEDWLSDEYGFCVGSFSVLDEEYLHNNRQMRGFGCAYLNGGNRKWK